MATRPKRKRKSGVSPAGRPATATQDETAADGQDVEGLMRECMAAMIPAIESTCREVLSKHRAPPATAAAATTTTPPPPNSSTDMTPGDSHCQQSLLQDLTGTTTPYVPSETPERAQTSSGATLLTLGIDEKTRAKIHTGDYIKFETLLPSNSSAPSHYTSVDQDGQLVFIKSTEKDPIKTLSRWTEAFHVFVAIFAEKCPQEIGNLMLYAQTIRKIAESCGDQAALQYDEKFRRLRQSNPSTCPWQHKHAELYQEALVLGLDYKLKSLKQQPFRNPPKHRYCFSYNNHGTCPKGNTCPHPHVCQLCAGKHWRKFCPKFSPSKPKQNSRANISSASKPPTTISK